MLAAQPDQLRDIAGLLNRLAEESSSLGAIARIQELWDAGMPRAVEDLLNALRAADAQRRDALDRLALVISQLALSFEQIDAEFTHKFQSE